MTKALKKYSFPIFAVLLISYLLIGSPFSADIPIDENISGESMEGVVLNAHALPVPENSPPEQKLEIVITKGSLKNQTISIEYKAADSGPQEFKEKDKLIVVREKNPEGKDIFFVHDYIRNNTLIYLFAIFVAVLVIVAGTQGFFALLGMIASFVVIFKFLLPQMLSGASPILTVIISALFIVPLTFYLSHGFSRKTHIAILGTSITLVITGALAIIFSELSLLTGMASETYVYLSDPLKENLDFKGLLLAGMIISILGVLDDVTISQSSLVQELKTANPKLPFKKLYASAMKVGKDHIASMVNTLILVYTGASLPLLLLFLNYNENFMQVINYEFLASEIIQTLVGSTGLILAVPITTLLAGLVFAKEKKR